LQSWLHRFRWCKTDVSSSIQAVILVVITDVLITGAELERAIYSYQERHNQNYQEILETIFFISLSALNADSCESICSANATEAAIRCSSAFLHSEHGVTNYSVLVVTLLSGEFTKLSIVSLLSHISGIAGDGTG
jgi:hypothetical protein